MINVIDRGVLLQKTELGFENQAVLNPATIRDGNYVHMFYRAVREGNYSTIGYCKMEGPKTIIERSDIPVIIPHLDYESHGIEDPRIVKIDDLYYLTYIAFDGVNAMGALMTSKDLKTFESHGLIVPKFSFEEFKRHAECKSPLNKKYSRYAHDNIKEKNGKKIYVWDKDVVFFPRRINKKLVFLHRIKPDIQITSINEINELTTEFWENYLMHFDDNIVLAPKYAHEISYIGAGCPPIETEHGWLLIYHGVHDEVEGYVYSACAALLDLNDPRKEIARLPYPLFKPINAWELSGDVNNVVFPTGTALFDDILHIYYGAADEEIGHISVSLSGLVKELLLHTGQEGK
ncbi:glycosidase [soil metagenome]